MRLRSLFVAAAMLSASVIAHADTFTFTINGSAGGFSGTGTFSGNQVATGKYLIDTISGTGITGLLGVGTYQGNDNDFYTAASGSTTLVDTSGIAFVDQNPSGVFDVNLHSIGTNYFVTFTEIDTPNGSTVTNLPVTLALLSTGVLGAFGVARRRFAR